MGKTKTFAISNKKGTRHYRYELPIELFSNVHDVCGKALKEFSKEMNLSNINDWLISQVKG